ncbi:hypothetical protein [Nesterenkonia muleiensis]|uniref:hypothetical protein n=1 Tax=Nesterenkonia muleiensis TaxID=2282648 RepID=UPI000E748C2C|nr:hypothetical protein [Nesterenkonia muleiensis]
MTTKKTISKPRRRTRHPVFREMAFTQMADPKAAAACMEHLASSTEIGTTVLEMRARGNKDGAAASRWFLAAGAAHLQDVEGLLRTHLPVHIHQQKHIRRTPDMAATIRLRGSHPHLNPAHIEDAARAVFGVIASLGNHDELTIQLMLGRRHSPPMHHREAWSQFFQVLLAGGKTPERNPDPSAALRTRAQQHGFDSAIRIAAKVSTPERARHLISKLRSALKVLEASGTRLQLANIQAKRVDNATRPWKWPLRLASSEAAAVAAWPLGTGDLPAFGTGHPRMFPPPPKMPTNSRVIGISAASGFEEEKVALPIQSASYMTHLCGPTGVGKSTAMLNLITHDMGLGSSVVLIDMKGDLATDVLARVPVHRHKDVVVLDAAADTVVGLNPCMHPTEWKPKPLTNSWLSSRVWMTAPGVWACARRSPRRCTP